MSEPSVSSMEEIYLSSSPSFSEPKYTCQGEVALIGIVNRNQETELELQLKILLPIFRVLSQFDQPLLDLFLWELIKISQHHSWQKLLPHGLKPIADELALHARKILQRFPPDTEIETKNKFINWIKQLEKPTSQKKLKTKKKRNRR